MRRIRAVARKEWLHIIRDPRSLIAALTLPVVLLVLYGYAVNLDLNELEWAVCDQDQSATSRALIANMSGLERFTFVGAIDDPEDTEQLFRLGTARGVVVLPAGLERDVFAGRTVPVQVLIDGSEGTIASLAQSYLEGAVNAFGAQISRDQARRRGLAGALGGQAIEARTRIYYNPDLISRKFLVPGLIAIVLMMLAALLTSGVVVRERERGTFELLAASPIAPSDLIIGRLLPYILLGLVDVVIAVVIGWVLFDVPVVGSPLALIVVSAIFVLTASAIGLFFSCVTSTQQAAMLLALASTVIPTMLLSGFAYHVRNMPLFLQGVAQVLPATHYIALLRGIILRGAGLMHMWPNVAALVAIGLVWPTLAIRRFRKAL